MLEDVNAHDDLSLFSKTAGVDMPYNWPEFEVRYFVFNALRNFSIKILGKICAQIYY